ncbi:MAG: GNAT family N-acetyltransferase [Clostridia bacterium]|nr:GNAT family N-acetyltransferase [Clostridia bacterium]
MKGYNIRRIQESDFINFYSLCSIGEPYYELVLQHSVSIKETEEYRNNCFVAYHDNVLIGYVFGFAFNGTLFPQFLFVNRDYRQRGVATSLLQAVEKFSDCTDSLIYFQKALGTYYAKQAYNIGTNLLVAHKKLP